MKITLNNDFVARKEIGGERIPIIRIKYNWSTFNSWTERTVLLGKFLEKKKKKMMFQLFLSQKEVLATDILWDQSRRSTSGES